MVLRHFRRHRPHPVYGAVTNSLDVTVGGTVRTFWVRVINTHGSSDSRTVTVQPLQNALPVITVQPSDTTGNIGSPIDLTVTATNATSYQWYQGYSGVTSSPVANGTGSSLHLSLVDGAHYWVRVRNPSGAVDSRTVVTSAPPSGLPTITTQPQDVALTIPRPGEFDSHSSERSVVPVVSGTVRQYELTHPKVRQRPRSS